MNATTVLIPLLNPNEPEAALTAVYVREGQPVSAGDLLFSLETTKSAADVTSEAAGYVTGLRCEPGQVVRAGEVFCYLAETPQEQPASPAVLEGQLSSGGPETLPEPLPDGLRITQPALALARLHGLDLRRLPAGPLVTESLARSYLVDEAPGSARPSPKNETPAKGAVSPDYSPPAGPFEPGAILIYGGGGHGKIIIDILSALPHYQIAGLLDDGRAPGEQIMGVPVLGGAELLPRLYDQGVRLAVNAIGGIGSISVRIKIFRRLAEAGYACPALVHPSALVERSAVLAPGVQVLALAYLGSEARAGYGCIISTGVIVSHDCRLGDYANLSPGATLAGDVQVGAGALVGMGVTVNMGVKIGAGARLGNGATILKDVPEGGVVRAGTIWPK